MKILVLEAAIPFILQKDGRFVLPGKMVLPHGTGFLMKKILSYTTRNKIDDKPAFSWWLKNTFNR
jgi:hypothetical protein